MAAPASTSELLDFVRKSDVLPAEALDRFVAEYGDLPADATKAAAFLVQKKLLTAFQAKLLLVGRYKGFRLGAYILRDQLGQGGMGTVYLAMHDTLRRKAAVKVLPPGGNKLSVERFLREARAAAALDHPNIVRTHDVGRDGDVHFLVMEYVDGQTLDRLIAASGPLTTQRAVEYIAQAATGLQHAYEQGFIHRDIKPSNLILSKDGTVKILDMGLARSFEKDDQLTALLDHDAVVGTADYISPEQAMNDPKVDIRTDIYSLGATFFSILTGRPPFDGPTASKLIQHQMKEAPSLSKLDKTIPKVLAQVVAKMMMKKPGDRYQTPADVIVALQPWLSDTPSLLAGLSQTQAAGSGKLSSQNLYLREGKPTRKKSNWIWALAGGVAALLLLTAGVALAVMLGGSPEKDQTKTTYPTTNPTTVATTPAVLEQAGRELYAFSANSVEPFRAVMEVSRTVEGQLAQLPKGLGPISWKEGSRGEFVLGDYKGRKSLTLCNLSDDPELNSAQLSFQLETDLGIRLEPNGKYVVAIEYATKGYGNGAVCLQSLDFKNLGREVLLVTDGEWKTVSLLFQRKPEVPVRITVDSYAAGIANGLVFGKLTVRSLDGKATEPSPTLSPAAGVTLSKLDWTAAKPVTIRSRTVEDKANPGRVLNSIISRVGEGKFPAGWTIYPWNWDTIAEATIDKSQGDWAFGIRNAEGPGSTMLLTPQFTSDTGYCRLRCEVLYSGKKYGAQIRVYPESDKASDAFPIDAQPGWRTLDILIDCKTRGRVKFEFHNNSANPDEFLWVRKYEVLSAEPGDAVNK